MDRYNPWQYKAFRMLFYVLLMVPFLFSVLPWDWMAAEDGTEQEGQGNGLVYVVPVQDEIERGLRAFMERAFAEAEEEFADHIILDINTPGGAVPATEEIGEAMRQTDIPITAYVNSNASSAGAFISLNADHIVMAPNGSMGAATVIDMEGNAADDKMMAHWISKMEGAAKLNDRDPLYAAAMVDPSIEIEGVVSGDSVLNFNTSEALEHGYAEAEAEDLSEVLGFLDMEGANIEEVELAFSENLARFITNPLIASILMSLGGLGLILELYSPGFGVAGGIGLASILLFFFGHMIAGFAGMESLLLFIAGVVLLAIEIFMTGFGIFGILGIAAIGGGLTLASEDTMTGLMNLGIALVITVVVAAILAKYLNTKGVWSRLVLEEGLDTEETLTTFQKKTELVGREGTTLTQLRPSGTIILDGKQYDVVSSGHFIDKNIPVEVIQVEGPRMVVKEIEEEES